MPALKRFKASDYQWKRMAKALGRLEHLTPEEAEEIVRVRPWYVDSRAPAMSMPTEGIIQAGDWYIHSCIVSESAIPTRELVSMARRVIRATRKGGRPPSPHDFKEPDEQRLYQTFVRELRSVAIRHRLDFGALHTDSVSEVTALLQKAIVEWSDIVEAGVRIPMISENRKVLINLLSKEYHSLSGAQSATRNDMDQFGRTTKFVKFLLAFWRTLPRRYAGRFSPALLNDWAREARYRSSDTWDSEKAKKSPRAP